MYAYLLALQRETPQEAIQEITFPIRVLRHAYACWIKATVAAAEPDDRQGWIPDSIDGGGGLPRLAADDIDIDSETRAHQSS